MTGPGASPVRDALAAHVVRHPDVTRWCVAYSGGMDSHVLLHVAAGLLGGGDAVRLRAVHVDHGTHEDSGGWARHAASVAASLGVPLVVRRVRVERGNEGPEAAARAARLAAFAAVLEPGEHLLLAQHAGDQAETFLLRALRGSGPDGLAAIPRERPFAAGVMVRPLLACPREALLAEAEAAGLDWIEDPSNADTAFDRNYLRHEILPRLAARWPAATRTLGRSAERAAAASRTLLELAAEDLERSRADAASGPSVAEPSTAEPSGAEPSAAEPSAAEPSSAVELSVHRLRALPRERAGNAIRLWVRRAGFRAPGSRDLEQVLDALVGARPGTGGLVDARDYEFRRYRDRLHLLAPRREIGAFEYLWRAPFDDLAVPEADLVLTREACARQGLALPDTGVVTVASRTGGERIRVGEPAFHKAVKKLLQEAGVPPWRRAATPLLYVDGRLAAVWNLAVATEFRVRASSGTAPPPAGRPPAGA